METTTQQSPITARVLSFSGSARRILRPFHAATSKVAKYNFLMLAFVAIPLVWTLILSYYATFGLVVIPWRCLTHGRRKRNATTARYQAEMLAAVRANHA